MEKIYKLSTYAISGIMRYPKFKIYELCVSYHESFDKAREAMKATIKKYRREKLYCFYIYEFGVGLDYDKGIEEQKAWSFRADGQYNNETYSMGWWADIESGDSRYKGYMGRPESSIYFKQGDIVEVFCDGHVELDIVLAPPISEEVIDKRYEKYKIENPDCKPREEYFWGDASDDNYLTLGCIHSDWDQISLTVNVFPCRKPVSERLKNKLMSNLKKYLG